MKLAVLLSAVLVSSAAAQGARAPIVVFVHGRMSAESDTGVTRRSWRSTLNASLSDAGYRPMADGDVRLAWYADALDPAAEGCPRPAEDEEGLGAFGVLLSVIVGSIPSDEARDARTFANDVMFILDESRRCAARQRVGREIERAIATGRSVVVLAYSLGSVVTYQYLQERPLRPGERPIDLVTIGSPLGVPGLRALLGLEADTLPMPPSVRSWRNIRDVDDPVAGPVTSGSAHGTIVDVLTSRSGAADAHRIEHYLRDRATAETLGRLLTSPE